MSRKYPFLCYTRNSLKFLTHLNSYNCSIYSDSCKVTHFCRRRLGTCFPTLSSISVTSLIFTNSNSRRELISFLYLPNKSTFLCCYKCTRSNGSLRLKLPISLLSIPRHCFARYIYAKELSFIWAFTSVASSLVEHTIVL
jgi:hypothetical protein